jgi:hypothetical protein
MRHGRSHPTCQRGHKGESGFNAGVRIVGFHQVISVPT